MGLQRMEQERGGGLTSIRVRIGKIFFSDFTTQLHKWYNTRKGGNILHAQERGDTMLTEMLSNSESFKKLPLPNQSIILTLANKFQEATMFLFLDPQELYDFTGLGTKEQWQNLLLMQETQNYLKGQMGFVAQIGQRKSFKALLEQAMNGNVQAAKQVQELSGIMNSVDNNKIIIMHRIPRPSDKEVTK